MKDAKLIANQIKSLEWTIMSVTGIVLLSFDHIGAGGMLIAMSFLMVAIEADKEKKEVASKEES